MESWVCAVAEAIHSSRAQAVLYLAGGASQALGWLLSMPGASSTILEVVVQYSRASMAQLLGKVLCVNADAQLPQDITCYFIKGFTEQRGRRQNFKQLFAQGNSRYLQSICSFQSGIHESEIPEESMEQFDEDQELQQVIDGQVCMKVYHFADPVQKNFNRKIILPGSFNPLHDGHLRLLEVASCICDDGLPIFEISAINADKPPLSIAEIKRRVEQFKKAGKNVIISNQPYFYKKAELFPGSAFIIGADTAARLVNPKYYGGDYNQMLDILLGCKSTGTNFLVGGRKIEGVFKVLEDLDIPGELRDMFISIPEEKFRLDISSTELRNTQKL